MNIKTTSMFPEMCECERLYKSCIDKDGKTMCPACYTGLSIDDLKKLWSIPINSQFTILDKSNE